MLLFMLFSILCTSIAGAKENAVQKAAQAVNGTAVRVKEASVSIAFSDFFYIEDSDRIAGIRVEKPMHSVKTGDKIDVMGQVHTNGNGERVITADSIMTVGSASAIRPVGMSNLSLGGWSWRWVKNASNKWIQVWQAYNTLTSGLYVRIWGHVTKVDPNGGYLFIDDGTHLLDYAKTRSGVKVISLSPFNPSQYSVGSFVVVTGVCSQYQDETKNDPLPMVYSVNIQVVLPK